MRIFKQILILLIISANIVLSDNDISIRIMATANVHNETDPCGWKKKPLGGLARKATVLDQQSAGIDNFYVVDAGNLFFKKESVDPGVTLEVAQINSEIILDSFNAMGCTAFSPGEFDFAAGLNYLLELEKKANFPFISCNIFTEQANQRIFDKYLLDVKEDYTIAFIGLTSVFSRDGISVGNPLDNLKIALEELKNKSDINVLLFHGNETDLSAIYNENLNIDLIVRSKDRKRSSDGGSKIPTFSLGDRGKIVCQFDLLIEDINERFTDVAWCDRTVNHFTTRLEKMKKGDLMADLKDLYQDNPATLQRIENYENQIILANQRMENLVNSLIYEKIELGTSVNGRIDILQIVDKGKEKINIIKGPQMEGPQMDSKGRIPGDPHHGHNH